MKPHWMYPPKWSNTYLEPSPSPTTAEPTTAEPTSSPTCVDNPEDSGFSCECFNNDPDPVNNCPRIDCVFDFGTDGCTDLPSGGAGNIPDGNPIQCDLNASPDECVDVNGEECTNSPNSNTGCTPDQANDFGCCKSMLCYSSRSLFLWYMSYCAVFTVHSRWTGFI